MSEISFIDDFNEQDLRDLVIKHFLNDDSELEIAMKVLIPRDSVHYIITKCNGNLIDRDRRRKTSTHAGRIR